MTTNSSHITSLHIRSVPVLDQDEALDFYTGHLGFEARDDIDLGFMRWLTIGVPGQDTSLLLELVGGPQHDESTASQVRELVTKGALGGLFLLSNDVHATYAALRDAGVEITQEPVRAALRHRLRHPRPVRQPRPDQPAQRRLPAGRQGDLRGVRRMSYPPPLYRGESGETSAHLVRAGVEPAVVYPNGNRVFYLAQGSETQGTFGLYRWEFAGPPSGPDAHFHRTITESFYVLEGTVTIFDGTDWVQDPRRRLRPRAGRRHPRVPQRGRRGEDAAPLRAGCTAGGLLRGARGRAWATSTATPTTGSCASTTTPGSDRAVLPRPERRPGGSSPSRVPSGRFFPVLRDEVPAHPS